LFHFGPDQDDIEVPQCGICLGTLGECSEIVTIKCGHVFGRSCLERCLEASCYGMRCPVCRRNTCHRDVVKIFIDPTIFSKINDTQRKKNREIKKLQMDVAFLQMESMNQQSEKTDSN